MTTTAEQQKSTAQRIWDAINDLYNQEQVVTRETLAEVTGMKMSIIDDHVGRMVDNEQLRRVRAGVFVPIPKCAPPRPVTGTMTPDGFLILELGELVWVLQQKEARMVGALTAGQFVQFSNIQSGHEAGVLAAEIYGKLKKEERARQALEIKLQEMEARLEGKLSPQAQLDLAST